MLPSDLVFGLIYNEGDHDEFEAVVERYHERFGYYPERIFAGKLYRNRKNRELCKRYGIRLSDPKLGKTIWKMLKIIFPLRKN